MSGLGNVWRTCLLAFVLLSGLSACGDAAADAGVPDVSAQMAQSGFVYLHPQVDLGRRRLSFDICVFDTGRYMPRVASNRKARESLAKFVSSSPRAPIAGVNGGFFLVNRFVPQGLVVASGQSEGTFDAKSWMDGAFIVRENAPALVARDDVVVTTGISDFVQSGPWLVRDGIAQKGFTNDEYQRRRTFICQGAANRWAIGICERATLHELAEALRSPFFNQYLDVRNALNLDGGPSTGFYMIGSSGQPVSREEEWPVPNFIVVEAVPEEHANP